MAKRVGGLGLNTKPTISLSFHFARESTKPVILRQGPSKVYRCILWDRAVDSFKDGQWFKGMIAADNFALSPDGGHFIYYATYYGRKGYELSDWTAISRPPWLTAIALYPHQYWNGTGRFLSNKYFVVRGPKEMGDTVGRTGKLERVFKSGETKNNAVGYTKYDGSRVPFSRLDREHLISDEPLPDYMRDYHCENGRLFRRHVNSGGDEQLELIRDFTDMQFENIRAPYDDRPDKDDVRPDKERDLLRWPPLDRN